MNLHKKTLLPFFLFASISLTGSIKAQEQPKKSGLSLAIDALKAQNDGKMPAQKSTTLRMPKPLEEVDPRIILESTSSPRDYFRKLSGSGRDEIFRCSPLSNQNPTHRALQALFSQENSHARAMSTLSNMSTLSKKS